MDWLELPTGSHGFDMVLVVIDRATRMVHLMATRKNATAESTANLLLNHVFKYHGLPRSIISDRDPRLINAYWSSLCTALDIHHKPTTAYHPSANGLVERANQTIGQLFRALTSPSANSGDWVAKLPLVEIAWNNAEVLGSGYSPYYLNYGQHPTFFMDPYDLADVEATSLDAKEWAMQLSELYYQFTLHLAKIQDSTAARVNQKRSIVQFHIGDKVMVNLVKRNLKLGKLQDRWFGPFPVRAIVAPDVYRLLLPADLRIHDVFHLSFLKLYVMPNSVASTSTNSSQLIEGNRPPERPPDEIPDEIQPEMVDEDDLADFNLFRYIPQAKVKLHPNIFSEVCQELKFRPTVDMFASAELHQLPRYCTRDRSDQYAYKINVYSWKWTNERAYINPPFKSIPKILGKIIADKAQVMMVIPYWPKSEWYWKWKRLKVNSLILDEPIYLSQKGKLRTKPPWMTEIGLLDGRRFLRGFKL